MVATLITDKVLNPIYFISGVRKCGGCKRTLKNKKRYYTFIKYLKNKYWTIVKVCRKCGTHNYKVSKTEE